MDAGQKQGNGDASPVPTLTLITVLVGIFFLSDTALSPSRPTVAQTPSLQNEDVRSRLWQDPFTTVMRYMHDNSELEKYEAKSVSNEDGGDSVNGKVSLVSKNRAYVTDGERAWPVCVASGGSHEMVNQSRKSVNQPHTFSELKCQVRKKLVTGNVLALAVMVKGEHYAEDVERRQRDRYAVISGLAEAGYHPVDATHIGFVNVKKLCLNGFMDDEKASTEFCGWPDFVPYEWYRTTRETDEHDEVVDQHVLVLWVNDDVLARQKPLHTLIRLRAEITPDADYEKVRYGVLGPASSDTLKSMYEEANTGIQRNNGEVLDDIHALMDFNIVSSRSTVDTATIKSITNTDDMHSHVRWLDQKLVSATQTDDLLAKSLVCELSRRGVAPFSVSGPSGKDDYYKAVKKSIEDQCVNPVFRGRRGQNHLVLIGEWDTLYSRNIKRQINKFICDTNKSECDANLQSAPWVHGYYYFRGLDGDTAKTEADRNEKKNTGGDKRANEMIRRPVGSSQLDYLRRMADDIEALDMKLASPDADHRGYISAIGIVGSDDYDKLLILQALRRRFSEKLFFTTDLDARMLHPEERSWTKNLIVASSFGLRLNGVLQPHTPSFRDSYQSALFFSTLVAAGHSKRTTEDLLRLSEIVRNDINPRIFEIGRSSAVDLSRPDTPTGAWFSLNGKDISGIHPRPSTRYVSSVVDKGMVISVLVTLPLLFLMLIRFAPRQSIVVFIAFLLAVIGLICFHLFSERADFFNSFNEPLTFSEGVSMWSTNMIRMSAYLMTAALIAISVMKLNRNRKDIESRFGFDRAVARCPLFICGNRRMVKKLLGHRRTYRLLTCIKNLFLFTSPDYRQAGDYWTLYLFHEHFICRFIRVFIIAFIYMLALIGFMIVYTRASMGSLPSSYWSILVPMRGDEHKYIGLIIMLFSTYAFIFHMFFVYDVSRSYSRLITALESNINNIQWGSPSGMADYGVSGRVREYQAFFEFIVERSKAVDPLIYYPFIILFILLIALHSYFDNWHIPLSLVVVSVMHSLVALWSAIRLRRAALNARNTIVKNLDQCYVDQLCAEQEQVKNNMEIREYCSESTRISKLVDDISGYRKGPYIHWSKHPIIKAVVLPFGGVGGLYIIDYLAGLG